MDRISKLPVGLIETILCLLPIQEAAKTSILRKEWRYHWIKIPKLAFSEDTFQVSTEWVEPSVLQQTFDHQLSNERKRMDKRCKLLYAIYQVLLIHQGPLYEFSLRIKADGSCIEIDHIIFLLLKKNTVKILKLDFIGNCTLPLSLFSMHQLTQLYLYRCVLDHLPSSCGFRSLTTLHLQNIWTYENVLLRLVSGCPSLKKVTIDSDSTSVASSQDSSIADLFACLSLLEYLSVRFYIVECFEPLPKKLPTTFVHLKYLCIESVNFNHKDSLPFLVLLIKSSPNLKKLKLELLAMGLVEDYDMGFFTLEDYSDIMLEHLNQVEILNFSYEDNELVLLKLILAKSPVLKNMNILLWDEFDEDQKLDVKEGILSLPYASPAAKVTVS